MNQHLRYGGAVLALLAAAAAPAQTATSAGATPLAAGDQKILAELAQANMAEVAAAHIALKKSGTPEVRNFAQQMVDDHSKGLQAVQDVARNKNVTLPAAPDARHQQLAAHLNGLSGAEFDKAYLASAGVQDHKAAHAQVQAAQKQARDADVRALAAQLQPTIDQHLQMVQGLARER
jgi:putative membrane protein